MIPGPPSSTGPGRKPSSKLKAIIDANRGRAAAATPARPPETRSAQSLVDKREALPDARALARMFRSQELESVLPSDEDEPAPPPPVRPQEAPEDRATAPPLSPAEVRRVLASIQDVFASAPGSYAIVEPMLKPVDVPVYDPNEIEEEELPPPKEDWSWLLGAVVALILVGGFLYLVLLGPLRARPAVTPSPSASASPQHP